MAVYTIDAPTTKARLGSLTQTLDATLQRLVNYKAFLDTIPDATLISSYGFVQADIDIMRSTLNDLVQLNSIYTGGATLGVAKDFRTFAKLTYPFGSV